jgi:molybdenum cofactor cytidylyltransferase
MSEAYQVGVVILGAGKSQRMGRPKLLLPWGESTVIGHIVRVWETLPVSQMVLVCAPVPGSAGGQSGPDPVGASTPLLLELDRLGLGPDRRIINPEPERGMFSSIQAAAAWLGWKATLTHHAIALGDQPQLSRKTLEILLRFSQAHPQKICQPSYHGRPGHPVILPANVFKGLPQSAATTLREVLAGHELALCEVDAPELHLDLDTPQDYDRALKDWSSAP